MRTDCHSDTALWLLEKESLMDIPQAHQDYRRIGAYLDLAFLDIFLDEAEHKEDAPAYFQFILRRLTADIAAHPAWVAPLLWREQLDAPNTGGTLPKLVLIAMEGAAGLGEDSEYLDAYFAAGLRLIGLTWNYANRYAGGCASDAGFSRAGWDLVASCNAIGVLLDGAHLNRRSFWDLCEASRAPFIVSHSCCAGLHEHRRNLDDSQMRALAERGGVMGVTFVPDFLGGAGDFDRLLEHIEYAVSLIGSDHVALGSDFDGSDLCTGLTGVESLPALYAALAARGMAEADIANVAGLSVRGLLSRVLPARDQG